MPGWMKGVPGRPGPSRPSVRGRCHGLQAMGEALGKELASVPRSGLTLHHDAWTDRFGRVWILGTVSWLAEIPATQVLELQVRAVAFEQAARWASAEAGSQHCAGVAATALRSSWRLLDLGELPAWATSDSANAAVAASRHLGCREKRCVVHLLLIPAQRTLHGKKPRGAVFVPESAYESHPAPDLLRAFEALRAVALWLGDADHAAAFRRLSRNAELEVVLPKLDASSKWESTLEMATAGLACMDALRQMQAHPDGEGMPELPTPDQLRLIEEASAALEVVMATVDTLQRDDALLASYLPLSTALRGALAKQGSDFARLYVAELNGVEDRNNLKKPFSVGPSKLCPFKTPWDLAAAASLLHPRFRSGGHLGDAVRDVQRLALGHAAALYMLAHGISDPDAIVNTAHAPPEGQPARRRLRRSGAAELEAALAEVHGGGDPGPVAAPHPGQRRLKEAALDEGRSFMQGPPILENPLAWWAREGKRVFPVLYPAALDLLQHRSGNAGEERIFSQAGRVLGDKRSKTADVRARLLLRANGARLGMAGYQPAGPSAEANEDVEAAWPSLRQEE